MAATLTEGIVDRLLAFFRAEMPGKLESIRQEMGDDVPLPAPELYLAGERPLNQSMTYPALFVIGDRTRIDRYGTTYTDAVHEVRIRIAHRGSNPDHLRRALYRYMEVAIWELLVLRFFIGDGSDYFTTEEPEIEFEQPDDLGAGPYVYAATMTVLFNKQQEER